MKKFFCIISSLFVFSVFSMDIGDTKQALNETIDTDLTEDFYFKASTNPSILKRGSVILFTNARDEKNIKEWAAHHLLLGFDLIYIFDHKSEKPLIEEFKNFDKRVIVERCEWESGIKNPLMNRAATLAKKLKAKWMLYIDADEFLVLNDFNDVKSLLNAFRHADSIGINWLLFGSNNHVKEPEGLILENYTRSTPYLDQHVKSFVRPSQIVEATNPHYYCIKNPKKMFSINNKILKEMPCFNDWIVEPFTSPAYFAHYLYQSEESYMKRKIFLPRDDSGGFRDVVPNIHVHYNEIENLVPKEKYASQVKLFLEQYENK
jgi:Glycosyl transferase family 2